MSVGTIAAIALLSVGLVAIIQEVGVYAGAFLAIAAALTWIVRKLHLVGRWLHEVNEAMALVKHIVTNELTHNAGRSMKDQLTDVRKEQNRLRDEFQSHLIDLESHNRDPNAHS